MKLNIYQSADETLFNLAEYFVAAANESTEKNGRFSVALSGGSSPKKLYELLASDSFKTKVDWSKIHFFFGDERNVPQTDKDSNYLMAKKALFDPLKIDAGNIYPVNTALSPAEAAVDYVGDISKYFNGNEWRFDLVLLGLGDNSHTASLFPHTDVLYDKVPYVKEVWLEEQQVFRITLNAPLINKAQRIAFLVYGEGKAFAVHHILEDSHDILNYPAQLIEPDFGELVWFLDEAAAAELKNAASY